MIKKLLLALLFFTTLLNATEPTEESVAKLYIATFDRAPDAAGLSYWLNDSGLSLEQIAMSFFDQRETQEKYPPGFSNADFIYAVYANLFDRAPESGGFEYWLGELESGRVSRDLFILTVMNGAQGTDADILNNKTTVGLAFAHDGRNDASQAREILENVTADPQSVTDTLCKYSLGPCLIIPIPNPITPPVPPTNHAPIANAGADQNGSVGTLVTLDGSGSSDPDGDPLTYHWTLTFGQSNPAVGVAQSGAVLSDPTAVNPTFMPDEEGIYTATLIVNDGTVDSVADTVMVTVTPPDPTPISTPTISMADVSVNDEGGFGNVPVGTPTVTGVVANAVYSIVGDPTSGMLTINATTGEMTWFGDVWGDQTYTITIKVTNPDTGTVSDTFVLTVNDNG